MTELTAKYRQVFKSQIGKDVLADILTLTHFGCTLNTIEEAAVHNVGVKILMRMGIFAPGTKEDVIRALQTVTPKIKEATK